MLAPCSSKARAASVAGTLKYTGEPAEKMHGSKVVHGLRGYYDDVDAIVSFHPFYMLPLCNTARWDTQCGAYYSKVYTFLCEAPETWQCGHGDSPIPASHSAARAPGANLALTQMYSASRSMQDAILPATGGWSLTDAILSDGQATADNLPARSARIQFSWRTPDIAMAEAILTALDRNAAAAAMMAHCTVEETWVARSRSGRTNHVLSTALFDEHSAHGVGVVGTATCAGSPPSKRPITLSYERSEGDHAMPDLANGNYVSRADADRQWVPAAREVLIETAREYGTWSTEDELSRRIQASTGITTRQPTLDWSGRELGKVADGAHKRGEPQLASLCVQADLTSAAGCSGVAAGRDARTRERIAAEERFACYRWHGATMPEDGGAPVVFARVPDRPERARAAPRTRTMPRAHAAQRPQLREVTCPNCFTVVLAASTCRVCSEALPGSDA